MHDEVSHPLPEDPALASAASAFESAGYWAEVVDCQWRNFMPREAAARLSSF